MQTHGMPPLPTLPASYNGYVYRIVGNTEVGTYHAQISKEGDEKIFPGPNATSVVEAVKKAREAIDRMVVITAPDVPVKETKADTTDAVKATKRRSTKTKAKK